MKLRVYLQLGRVSNLPTVWSNVLAGVILAGGTLEPLRLGLLGGALSLFYVGGMFLNDAFDRSIDARLRPDRPIPSGRVSAGEVFAIGFGLLAGGFGVLVLEGFVVPGGRHSAASLWSGAALGAAIVLYDVWHKSNPLSPLVMGLCRMLVYVTAGFAVAPAPMVGVFGALVLLAYLIGLTFVAKQETLKKPGSWWPLIFLAAPLVYGARAMLESVLATVSWIVLALWVGFTLGAVIKGKIGQAVVQFIAGISLVDALLMASAGAGVIPVGIAVGCFGLTLALQRFVKGT